MSNVLSVCVFPIGEKIWFLFNSFGFFFSFSLLFFWCVLCVYCRIWECHHHFSFSKWKIFNNCFGLPYILYIKMYCVYYIFVWIVYAVFWFSISLFFSYCRIYSVFIIIYRNYYYFFCSFYLAIHDKITGLYSQQ